ncbi:MAG: hypothetical protein M3R36_04085 [Bacteroidota bacterium]|nr:hypothetical protein [Bacteroidota bacterium]
MSLEEKYNFNNFIQRIYINESGKDLYAMFSKGENLVKWFVKNSSYHTETGELRNNNESFKTNDEYLWEWTDGAKLAGKILEADGKENFKFTFGNDVTIHLKLIKAGSRTLVELTQLQNIPDYEMRFENYMACFPGWSFYLINLKSICEGGIDLREKNPDIELLVNI